MTDCQNSTIKINLSTREFEITGSSDFVNDHLGDMLKLISSIPVVNSSTVKESNSPESSTDTENAKNDSYGGGRIYRLNEDGSVDICKRLAGTSKSDRMKKIAMILLFAKDNSALTLSELREACEKQGCWDGHNASTIFNNPTLFIKKGKSKIWTLELTMDGQELAQQILEELANAK